MTQQDLSQQFFGLLVLICIFCYIAVSVRCFVRAKILRTFGADDWLLVVSLIVFTVMACMYFTAIYYGMGKPIAALNSLDILYNFKYQLLATMVYLICGITLKFSIGLLLARFAPRQWYHYVLRTAMALVFLVNTTMLFIVVFACWPLHYVWDHKGEGKCEDPMINKKFGYVCSAVNVAADWTFALLPVFMLWNIQMSFWVKVSTVFLLGLGVFASIATVVRLTYFSALSVSLSAWNVWCPTAIWGIVEIGIGFVASSAVAFRPLFRYFSTRESSTVERSAGGMNGSSYFYSTDTTDQISVIRAEISSKEIASKT